MSGTFEQPTLIDPAHDIAQNALCVVVDFVLDVFRRPVRTGCDRHRQDVVELGARTALELFLNGCNVDLVIMGRV